MFDKINHVYLLFALIIITLLSVILKWEATVLLAMITFLHGSYVVVVKSYEKGRKIEPEDDPTGNTNIRKKLYDYM